MRQRTGDDHVLSHSGRIPVDGGRAIVEEQDSGRSGKGGARFITPEALVHTTEEL
jgi:hypothetical protein